MDEVDNIYGGVSGAFHDVASFRAEMPDAAITDDQIRQLMMDDYKNVKQNEDVENKKQERLRNELQAERSRAERERARAEAAERRPTTTTYIDPYRGDLLGTELALERTRRRIAENLLDPYGVSPSTRYLERERIKRELKNELKTPIVKVQIKRSTSKQRKRSKSKPKKGKKKSKR